MDADFRRGLDALFAAAIGTLAGILADSGFTVRDAVLAPLYWLLGPAFDLFRSFPNTQLVFAGVVERLPIVLILGFGVGMFLRNIRYRELLLWTVPVWPACALVRKLAAATDASAFAAQAAVYAMEYALLILLIRWTHAFLLRVDGKGRPPGAA
jgi:hypothetical protein